MVTTTQVGGGEWGVANNCFPHPTPHPSPLFATPHPRPYLPPPQLFATPTLICHPHPNLPPHPCLPTPSLSVNPHPCLPSLSPSPICYPHPYLLPLSLYLFTYNIIVDWRLLIRVLIFSMFRFRFVHSAIERVIPFFFLSTSWKYWYISTSTTNYEQKHK